MLNEKERESLRAKWEHPYLPGIMGAPLYRADGRWERKPLNGVEMKRSR